MPKKEKNGFDIHVISQTHWDREWRYSFQKNRMFLVEMMDKMLKIMGKDPNYKYFHLDSQTIPIEDYLEIRPENKDKIKELVQAGRLLIGPWYCLPDEFLVSGESLVRNLLTGHRIAKEYGKPMKVGYTPFSWGQISQLPQLYAGFGIDTILFYRGVSTAQAPNAEFMWEGADGTKAYASRFSSWPRYNFWYFIYRRVLYGRHPHQREYLWKEGGLPFKVCDSWAGIDADYEMLDRKITYRNENIKDYCDELVGMQKDDFSTNQLVWMNGHDSSCPHPLEPKIIADCKTARPDDNVFHSSFPKYVEKLKASVKNLVTLKGEMRYVYQTPSISVLYGYVTSARMYLKQMNTATERKLQNYAEPYASFAWILGDDYPNGYLRMSWKKLLENHGHDAIGGCSVDGVHEDMMFRYKDSQELSQNVMYKSFQSIVKEIDTFDRSTEDIFLVAFNPLPFEREELLNPNIDIPNGMDFTTLGIKDSSSGKELNVQFRSEEKTFPVMEFLQDNPTMFHVERVNLHFPSGKIPAYGYKVYEVLRKKNLQRNFGTLATDRNQMENEFLKVQIQSDGTLKLTDKSTGNVFDRLHYFEDSGEAGSPWVVKPPYFDQVYTSLNLPATVTLVESGPLKTSYQITLTMYLPETLNYERTHRSETLKPVEIKSIITLKAGSKRLDVETKVNNIVEYHRLRVCFPSDVKVDHHYADGQFDVIKRDLFLGNDSTWNEAEMREKPQNNFVDISSDSRSLAIINDGIKEYEVLADTHRTIALTLLRSFSINIDLLGGGGVDYRELMKGSQCLGVQTYRYAIYPHTDKWDKAGVMESALEFNHPSRIVQCGKAMEKGTLPATELSFLSIPKGMVFSALKHAEHGNALILRIYNPTEKAIKGNVSFFKPVKKAESTTLEELTIEKVTPTAKGQIPVSAAPKKILTLKISF